MSEQKSIVQKVKVIIGEIVIFSLIFGFAMAASYIKNH